MQKFLNWFDKHLLAIGVGFLLIFIPLYPKLPLIDIWQTWVYIRMDDFAVALVVSLWLIQLARGKAKLKTPLTLPIFIYWLIAGLSVAHAVFLLSGQIMHFLPHLALLHFLRRIEYMVLFFIASASIINLQIFKKYLLVIGLTFFLVCAYGFGQKFLGWPAFLTMNEEFAKGTPFILGPNSRLASTFAGHYDLAAFLVIMITLWTSLFFGFKNKLVKILILLLSVAGFFLLLFTASRISFLVYLIAVSYMLLLQKKKWLIIPVIAISIFLAQKIDSSSQRFGKTFRVQRVVYDTKTGLPIATYEDFFAPTPTPTPEASPTPTPAVVAITKPKKPTLPEPTPTPEEELPLGTGFINLEGLTEEEARAQILRPIFTKSLDTATISAELATQSAEFLVKRALVYDISFTTRFQGEWPRAIEAFKRNIFLGSGLASISLATDNDYLRFLGETGLLGLISFLGILVVFGLLISWALPKITTPLPRSFLIGVWAAALGLLLNASLIDVFEASKVAYVFWLLLGISVGLIQFLRPEKKNLFSEALKVAQSPLIAFAVLSLLTGLIFLPATKNYFSGDDFTWLRWAMSTKPSEILQYFTASQGFFYRPLAKLYFYQVSPFFGLRSYGYHLVSILLHLGTTMAAYFIVRLLTKKPLAAFAASLLFLLNPINSETIFWVSTTSHLFASFFYLWAFVSYLAWRKTESRWRWLFLAAAWLSFGLSLLSHERAVTFPLIIAFYDLIFDQFKKHKQWTTRVSVHLPFWALLSGYLWLRNVIAEAHYLSGDYNYSLKNLPFNLLGNLFGYLGEVAAGFRFIPFYDLSRDFLKTHKLIALIAIIAFLVIIKILNRKIRVRLNKVVFFSLGWFIILLLPFIAMGNIAERYVYPAHLTLFLLFGLCLEWLILKLARKKLAGQIVISAVILTIISVFYIREMNAARQSWYEAGETANTILRTMATNYREFPLSTHLYFVNLPLRYNRAWVFPVGLKDGLWFIYRDDSLLVHQEQDIQRAFDLAEAQETTSHVFVFVDDELKKARRE